VVELAPNLEYGCGLNGGQDVSNTDFDVIVLEFLSGTILDILVEAYKLGRQDSGNGVADNTSDDYE
jgi:hypothetical protein